MIRRELRVPAAAERVWEAITEPDAMRGWFGAAVDWDLRPGGRATFRDAGGRRDGVVQAVEPGKSLRFLWWPSGDEGDASEVAYELDGNGDGTRLTVTERRVSVPDGGPAATASAAAGAAWTPADQVLLHVWAAASQAAASQAASARALA